MSKGGDSMTPALVAITAIIANNNDGLLTLLGAIPGAIPLPRDARHKFNPAAWARARAGRGKNYRPGLHVGNGNHLDGMPAGNQIGYTINHRA